MPEFSLTSVVRTLTSLCRLNSGLSPGDGRVRTDDPLLAKQVLSQLSYAPLNRQSPRLRAAGAPDFPLARASARRADRGKWAREDLNLRPHAYQACALTN
jgi:hypothetical protein